MACMMHALHAPAEHCVPMSYGAPNDPRMKLQILPEGTAVCEKYNVETLIGYGRYSCVYSATDFRGKSVALKLVPLKNRKEIICEEVSLSKLHDWKSPFRRLHGGVPRLCMAGVHGENQVMVLDRLGMSVRDYLYCNKKLSAKTVLMIGIRMIRILKYIHSKRIIHRDIKPDNILVGAGKQGLGKLYLIDFGSSHRLPKYRDQNSGKSVERKGTKLFMSTRTLNGECPTRMDDLESLGYTLWYLYGGKLPWDMRYMDALNSSVAELYLAEYEVRNQFLGKVDCSGITWLENMFNIIFDTEYDEIPDYHKLEGVMKMEMRAQGYRLDYGFDWINTESS